MAVALSLSPEHQAYQTFVLDSGMENYESTLFDGNNAELNALAGAMSDARMDYQFNSTGTRAEIAVQQQTYVDALRAFYIAGFANANQ